MQTKCRSELGAGRGGGGGTASGWEMPNAKEWCLEGEGSPSYEFENDVTGGGLQCSEEAKGLLATAATLKFFLEYKSIFNGVLRHKIRCQESGCQESVLGLGMGVGEVDRASFIAPEAPLFLQHQQMY